MRYLAGTIMESAPEWTLMGQQEVDQTEMVIIMQIFQKEIDYNFDLTFFCFFF